MKKLLAVFAVAFAFTAGLFAIDLGDFPKGTWQDSKWNANWTFGANSITLSDSVSGEMIFDFSGKMENFKVSPESTGLTISFDCAETRRSYKFTKPANLETSLNAEIKPEWDETYKVVMPFKSLTR